MIMVIDDIPARAHITNEDWSKKLYFLEIYKEPKPKTESNHVKKVLRKMGR
jgi:hypothetical protein